jgi:hypothetical protein
MENLRNTYNLTPTCKTYVKPMEQISRPHNPQNKQFNGKNNLPKCNCYTNTSNTAQQWENFTPLSREKPFCFTSKDQSKINFSGDCNKNQQCDKDVYRHQDTIAFCCYIKSLDPNTGPETGSLITINGHNLLCVTFILFGTKKITAFTVVDNNTIQFNALPMDSVRTVSVSVGNNNFISNELCYTYVQQPTITKITPNAGPIYGQNIVTITGTKLSTTEYILFGNVNIYNFNIINDQTVQFIAITAPLSLNNTTINVAIRTSAGLSNNLPYTYVLPPVI